MFATIKICKTVVKTQMNQLLILLQQIYGNDRIHWRFTEMELTFMLYLKDKQDFFFLGYTNR